MFFSGNLAIDPSQMTKIETHAPDGFFKKLVFTLTKIGGKKLEQESFSALSILQELKRVMQSAGINNVVRLAQDDIDFYFDHEEKDNDFDEALDKYDFEINQEYSSQFKVLHLILEHNKGSFKYLVDVKVNRTHKVGKYPIQINISGLLSEFKAKEGEEEAVKARMEEIFSSQTKYDAFLREKQTEFDSFMKNVEQHIRTYIRIDDVVADSQQKMVVPKEHAPKKMRDIAPSPGAPTTVFHGYPGMGGWLWYSMMWGSMCHSNNIHIQDTDLVSDDGDMIGSIGEEGMDAGDSSLFDSEVPLDERMSENMDDIDMDGMDGMDGGDMDGMDGMDGSDMGDIGGDGGGFFDSAGDGGFDFGGFDFGGFDF